MSFLARFRVLTKILAIVVLMAAIAGVISWLGVSALSSLNDGADDMSRAARRALTAARASQNVLVLSRSEFWTALDPRPENREQVRKIVDEQVKILTDRIEDIGKTRDEQAKAKLLVVKEAWSAYRQSMEDTYRLADGVKDVQLNDVTERLRDSAIKSRTAAEKLQESMGAVATRLSDRVDGFAKAASEEYETTSRLMMILAVLGTLFGMLAGFMIGQFGVAEPIRSIVELLRKLASGDFSAEIRGTDRKDEIGDIAKAAVVFKDTGLATNRMELEQKETEKRMAEQRKADMFKMANDFEGAVGEIIETVSSASSELEASAGTLTRTAERTQAVTTTVASARSFHECAIGGVRDRGIVVLGQRDQSPGPGIGANGQ